MGFKYHCSLSIFYRCEWPDWPSRHELSTSKTIVDESKHACMFGKLQHLLLRNAHAINNMQGILSRMMTVLHPMKNAVDTLSDQPGLRNMS
jgi:hypothetical protein